jgi:acyl-CoA synthetase (AMP-forming)/AMP-acid ligase II
MQLRNDVSGFQTYLTEALVAEKTAAGVWRNLTISDRAIARTAENPDALVLIDGNRDYRRGETLEQARRFGAALRRRGMRPGDVLAFQLPNWHEAIVIHLAAAIEGFVVNPIVPIYRDAELKFMLADGRAKALVITERFRNFDYVEMTRRIRGELPLLMHIIVVRGDSSEFAAYDALVQEPVSGEPPRVDPNAVKMLMYTSGTTGPAKGVLHSHNTILAEVQHYWDNWRLGENDVIYMPSSVCHIAGLAFASETPWALGAPAIVTERWQADAAIEVMLQRRATVFVGPTVFLQELLDAAERVGTNLPCLRLYICGGASVPPELIRRAHREWPHCITARVFGSTEVTSVTYGVMLEDDRNHAATTDGRIGPGWSLKIVDPETEVPVSPGEEGEILARGDEMLIGYSRCEDTLSSFDKEGYFRTGDIGRIVDDHYLLITDRKKDIIIRGGENISSREIEDAMQFMPGIGAVAAVAMPSPRLGEAVCLFVEVGEGRRTLTLNEVTALLGNAGLARQKLPERVEMIDELPRNPSGKVRKNILRRLIADKIAAEQQP